MGKINWSLARKIIRERRYQRRLEQEWSRIPGGCLPAAFWASFFNVPLDQVCPGKTINPPFFQGGPITFKSCRGG